MEVREPEFCLCGVFQALTMFCQVKCVLPNFVIEEIAVPKSCFDLKFVQ